MANLLYLVLLLPLLGGLVNALFGVLLPRRVSGGLAVASVGAAAALCLWLFWLADGDGTRVSLLTWLASGDLQVGFGLLFDRLSAPMALMVTVVSTLIHLYALGYMRAEADHARFFALLNLFVFAMLCIVLADNLVLLFLGWEGVGFCSYGLIGFWYREPKNADAGKKAFLVTRVGDVFLAVALFWLFASLGTLDIGALNAQAGSLAPAALTGIGLLLLGGAVGKSAQLPLMTWLPDAMAGPTPVSALIHAATMVTAGVYLLCRMFPLVSLSPTGLQAIALVGALTAFYGATCALRQREIKRVLAYSTMSQVGFMFLAVGVGAASGAMFHLLTHACFKALLFMGAGCVIALAGHENDITRMGGLRRKSPLVFWSFLAGALCLSGVPLTGGFFSKDAILVAAFSRGDAFHWVIYGLGSLTALLTAVYTFRLVYLVFAGEPRGVAPHGERAGHDQALPRVMRWTLPPLAVLGLAGGLLNLPAGWPLAGLLDGWLGPLAGSEVHASHALELALMGVATALGLVGWLLPRRWYAHFRPPAEGALDRFLLRGWKADRAYDLAFVRPYLAVGKLLHLGVDERLIDGGLEGAARGVGRAGRLAASLATGRLSSYLTALALGLAAMLVFFLVRLWAGG
jgi:NADH-quinone oxidoreductase subunit L